MGTDTLTSRAPMVDNDRSSLLKLYLGRGILAVTWAGVFSVNHRTLTATAVTLLIVYPLIDAVSSMIEYRALADGSKRRITLFNGFLSTLIALLLGLAGGSGTGPVLHVFGVWAIASGAVQMLVGLRRRSPELGGQWPMLVAGGLSLLVGVSYNVQAFADNPSLNVLALYATAGGAFFIVQACLLGLRARRSPSQTA
jgi:uncharacterized membrane protein HdeD (DUF308 family)